MILERQGDGPLFDRSDLAPLAPSIVDPSSVFNPGAIEVAATTVLLLRVQTRGRRTLTVPAVGNGIRFEVADRPVEFVGLERLGLEVFHNYDPRITRIGDEVFVVTALDTDQGCRLAVWRAAGSADRFARLDRLELAGLGAHADTRNGVLFPAIIDGVFLMLERPNLEVSEGGPASGSSIVLSATTDFETWQDRGLVMSGRPRYWDELIGPGPPPVRTRAGWLLVYHGVATHFASAHVYQAGAVLLDLADPTRVIGRTGDNILEPRETWELIGQVPNVVFPSGMTVTTTDAEGFAPPESEVRIYYGAADTNVGLATTTIGRLIEACCP